MPLVENSISINSKGQIAHGIGSAGAFLDNVQFDAGGNATWFTDSVIVYNHSGTDGWYIAYYDTTASPPTITRGHSNFGSTLGGNASGQWAAWEANQGLFTSTGYINPAAAILALGRDGSIAYRPVAEAANGLVLRRLNGTETTISSGPAQQVSIVGDGQLIWQENGVLKTYGMPNHRVLTGQIWYPKAVVVKGKWWLSYYSGDYGVVVHPIDSTKGFKPVTGDLFFDIAVLPESPTFIRFAWSSLPTEVSVQFVDIDTTKVGVELGASDSPPVVAPADMVVCPSGTRALKSSASYGVAAAAEELVTLPIEVFPAFPTESGRGRIIHPTLGAFDYEIKPDEWVNIDADAIIAPIWASSRTLTSAANVLWQGHLRDVVVEERWKALGGLSMPITQLRMLLAVWTTPIDPDVGYVHWFPNYITPLAFKVLPVMLSAGGQGLAFDDVVNYKDEDGNPIGWVTAPVTFQLKLVERL